MPHRVRDVIDDVSISRIWRRVGGVCHRLDPPFQLLLPVRHSLPCRVDWCGGRMHCFIPWCIVCIDDDDDDDDDDDLSGTYVSAYCF